MSDFPDILGMLIEVSLIAEGCEKILQEIEENMIEKRIIKKYKSIDEIYCKGCKRNEEDRYCSV